MRRARHVPSRSGLLREAYALRRQAVLATRRIGLRGAAIPARGPAEDVVFLVHGIFATAGVFGDLEDTLVREGVRHVASFTYPPTRRIPDLAALLSREIRALPSTARVHLVGHSMGGIVARHYVHELGGHARVTQTISLGSPFSGTRLASLGRLRLAEDLRRDSPLLARLRERAATSAVPHTSFVADEDAVVTPNHSAVLVVGDVVRVPECGHWGLLFHDGVHREIARRILAPARAA